MKQCLITIYIFCNKNNNIDNNNNNLYELKGEIHFSLIIHCFRVLLWNKLHHCINIHYTKDAVYWLNKNPDKQRKKKICRADQHAKSVS